MQHAMLRGRDKGAVMNIVESTAAYEAWLRAQLGDEVVEKDIDTKHANVHGTKGQHVNVGVTAVGPWGLTGIAVNSMIQKPLAARVGIHPNNGGRTRMLAKP